MASVAYWGYQTGKVPLTKIGLAVSVPVFIGVVWGLIISPKAPVQVPEPFPLLLEFIIFGLATAALYSTGLRPLAVVFGVAAVIHRVLMYIWGITQ